MAPRKAAQAPAKGSARTTGADSATAFRVLDRAMTLLRSLSRYPTGLSLSELSRETGLHKATALRFLRALEKGGFAASTPSKSWLLGPAIREIAAKSVGRADVRALARPLMEKTCRDVRQTVQLAILDGASITYLEKIEPPDLPLRINTQVGSRRPIHCTALGKALSAFHHDPAEIDRIIETAGMKKFTAQTITSPAAFAHELAKVRHDGHAVDDREYNNLVTCVAAPVHDPSGRTVAGLSISTVGLDVNSAQFARLIKAAKRTAKSISQAIGSH